MSVVTSKNKSMIERFAVRFAVLVLFPLFICGAASAQNTDSLLHKLDSLKSNADSLGQKNLIEPKFYNEKTKITLPVFGVLLLNDFKQQALYPFQWNRKKLVRGGVVLGVTLGIAFLDRPIQRAAVRFRQHNPGAKPYSSTLSDLGGPFEVVPLATIALTGLVFKNEKLRVTTALATQSYITSTVWSTILKAVTGRTRPVGFDRDQRLNSSQFHGPFYKLPYGENGSFPSGHTTLAFAAATVYAKEYKDIPIVPILSYGFAGLISISRIAENRHWATDIVSGFLLGFATGSQVVNNYHRYARLQRQGGGVKKKQSIRDRTSFILNYSPFGVIQPGLAVRL